LTVQRIVCFKFTDTATSPEKAKHMADFAALASEVPQIASYRGGFATSGDNGAPPDYDTLHYLTFANHDDVDAYYHHPAHQAFIEANKHAWADVLVLNAEIDE